MKTIFFLIVAITLLAACAKPEYYARTVKKEATCRFMQMHPIHDTLNGDLRLSYVMKYHAALYNDAIVQCNCAESKN
ncbi:MAG TPA: hypothetical protein VEV83_05905 [Parafilimonas sp.]|nr:hypothetical protein [Parafilimonas sp.]